MMNQNNDELGRAVAEFLGQREAQLTTEKARTEEDLRVAHALNKPIGSWSQADKDLVRAQVNAALKELGYR